ncbi:MAG: hypothetical protein ACAI44_24160 [Candidatus Sericytochromatia bacterium]
MSIRRLTLQEWFLCHQLAHIDRTHFHLDAWLEADMSTVRQAWGEGSFPLSFILVKALALTLRHVPEARRQYVRSLWGPRMLEAPGCAINVPVMLRFGTEDYLSVTTVQDADRKSVAEIQQEIRAYRQTRQQDLPVGRFIIGKPNTLLNRNRLRLIHAVINAFPQLQDQRGVGLASVSSLLNLDHAGSSLVLNGRGPGCISLTASHFDAASRRIRLALAFDHYAASGLTMARAGTTLCRILQAELEPEELLK